MKLTPIVLHKNDGYTVSKIREEKIIKQDDFIKYFADNGRAIQFEDGLRKITAYANGLDCWYIVSNENL